MNPTDTAPTWTPAAHRHPVDAGRRTMHGRRVLACPLSLFTDQYDPDARHLPHTWGDVWCPGYAVTRIACPDAVDAERGTFDDHGAHAWQDDAAFVWCRGYRTPGGARFAGEGDHAVWSPTRLGDRAAGWNHPNGDV